MVPVTRTSVGRQTKAPAPGAVRAALPDVQPPQLATLATSAPTGAEWISELKFDGYRLVVAVTGRAVRLLTRNGLDWTDRMPSLATTIAALNLPPVMLDGELVALRPDGVSSFPPLQAALKAGRDGDLAFYAFDLLHLAGWDLRSCLLLERKRVLATIVPWNGTVRYSDHQAGRTADLHQNACAMGLEGIICKRGDRPYRPGRSSDWLKLKCLFREELVVIGYTPPSGSRVGIGGLQLGYYDHDGHLHFAGGVGTGFSEAEVGRMRERLSSMPIVTPEG